MAVSVGKQTRAISFTGVLNNARRFFSSIKLALALILLISALSLFGTFVTAVDVFHSWWFLTAGALLMLNIIVCTLNRWSNIMLSLRGGSVKQDDDFYSSGAHYAGISTSLAPDFKVARIPVKILQKRGYRVRAEEHNGSYYLAADKNRHFRLGTYASHLSLVLFVLAYLLGSYFGFRDAGFTVAAGSTRPVGHNTGLSLQLLSFTAEYYPDNLPKDYRSQVILLENGREVTQAVVRVNHPLTYHGITIHQMYFGDAVQLRISQNGLTLYQGSVALDKLVSNQGLQRYVGSVDLPGGLNIQFIGSALNVQDPLIPLGQVAIYLQQNGAQVGVGVAAKSAPLSINGIDFMYQDNTRFSGFQVSRDPGNTMIWIASVLFILGISFVLYFPYRQVWVLYQACTDGTNRLLIRVGTPKGYSGAGELKILTAAIEKELQAKT